jgi:hypothetical protein
MTKQTAQAGEMSLGPTGAQQAGMIGPQTLALIEVFKRTPQSASGFTLARPSDCKAVVDQLGEVLARNRLAFRRGQTEFMKQSPIRDYPNELLRRFPSPLIKPDVRVSRILSDWFRCKAHDGNPAAERREPRRSCRGGISVFHGFANRRV